MSNAVEYAKNELDLLLQKLKAEDDTTDADLEMQILANNCVLELIKTLAKQGHSGFSANYVVQVFNRLASFKPLTPLTGADDEWGEDDRGCGFKQNKRRFSVFKNSDGTVKDSDGKVFSEDGGKTWFTSRDSFVEITFPYIVPNKPEYIILSNAEAGKGEK